MDLTKRIAGFAVAFFVVYFIIHNNFGSGKLAPFKEFRSDEGRFTVLMPGKPEVQNEAMNMPFGTVNTITYMAGSRKIGCIVSYADYPALLIKTTDPQKLLDGARDGTIKDGNGRLISETRINFHGLPARDVLIEIPGKAFTSTRYILKSPRFYALLFFTPEDKGHEQDISQFFNSFKIDGVK